MIPKPIKRIRPPVKTHGGKYYLSPWIIENFPKDHQDMVYVEVFAGGASVLFSKPRSRAEFINDIDQRMINLFLSLRDNGQAFLERIDEIEYTEEEFKRIQACQRSSGSSLDEAVWEYAARRMSRGGMRKAFAWSERKRGGRPGDENAWHTMKDNIPSICERLNGVVITNLSFSEVMNSFNDKNVFMYLDPPYLHETRSKSSTQVYSHEMDRDQHEKMLDMCVRSRAKILLSGYASKLYDDWLSEWVVQRKEIANHSSQSQSKARKSEVLWANYTITNA